MSKNLIPFHPELFIEEYNVCDSFLRDKLYIYTLYLQWINNNEYANTIIRTQIETLRIAQNDTNTKGHNFLIFNSIV